MVGWAERSEAQRGSFDGQRHCVGLRVAQPNLRVLPEFAMREPSGARNKQAGLKFFVQQEALRRRIAAVILFFQ
jgi:hypothetical protein